jgi:hypothetical protein
VTETITCIGTGTEYELTISSGGSVIYQETNTYGTEQAESEFTYVFTSAGSYELSCVIDGDGAGACNET